MAGDIAVVGHHRRAERLPRPPPPSPLHMSPFSPCYLVEREKTCPLMLRVFTKVGGHHTMKDFPVRGKEPEDEFQIYTWKDATLRELTDLVEEVTPAARRRDARLSFAIVFPDREGRFVVRPVGTTFVYGIRKLNDDRALAQVGFQIGDYLDVAIF